MAKRLLTAAVLVVVSLGALWLWTVDNLYFAIYINIGCLAAVYEVSKNLKQYLPILLRVLLLLFAACTYVIYRFLGFEAIIYTALLLFLVSFIYVLFDHSCTLATVSSFALTLVYPALILSVAYVMNAQENGLYYIVFFIATACFADAFAFFVGRTLKGPKLCPAVSPNKTISGAIGGLIGGLIAAVAVYFFFKGVFPDYPVYPIWILLIAGIFGALFDEVGDLAESFLKRQLGIKDFSNLLPGHGGVMDRIDGMLFVSFFTFFFFFVIL